VAAVSHPGDGLKPRRILELFLQEERGYSADMCDLFDDIIERDPHLRSQHEQRIDSVAGNEWMVLPGGDTEADWFAPPASSSWARR
jgi:phage gp29-like protein